VERFDGNGGWSHQETYNLSGGRKTMRLGMRSGTSRGRRARSGASETWIE
jgi:hypothetical protein